MTSHLVIETVESIVRSFGKGTFTMENVKAAMVNYPPRRRVNTITVAHVLKAQRLAEPIGSISIHTSKMSRRATTLWRSLI